VLCWQLLAGCSSYKVDSYEKYCGFTLEPSNLERRKPWWSASHRVEYDDDAILASFIDQLRKSETLDSGLDRKSKAWIEGTDLHIIEPSNRIGGDSHSVITHWEDGLAAVGSPYLFELEAPCRYVTAVTFFDTVVIHARASEDTELADSEVVVLRIERERQLW